MTPLPVGLLFRIPLGSDINGVGIITSTSPNGTILAYLFGPFLGRTTTAGIAARDAVMVCRTDGEAILAGRWVAVGIQEGYRASAWPTPVFGRLTSFGNAYRVTYDQHDTSIEIATRQVDPRAIEGLPRDGLYGYIALERALAKAFGVGDEQVSSMSRDDKDIAAKVVAMDDAADLLAIIPREGWPVLADVINGAATSPDEYMELPQAVRLAVAAMILEAKDGDPAYAVPHAVQRARAQLPEPAPHELRANLPMALGRLGGSELAEVFAEAGDADQFRSLIGSLMD